MRALPQKEKQVRRTKTMQGLYKKESAMHISLPDSREASIAVFTLLDK